MSERDLRRAIYLTGVAGDYRVRTGGFAGLPEAIPVSRAKIGHALVRLLRFIARRELR